MGNKSPYNKLLDVKPDVKLLDVKLLDVKPDVKPDVKLPDDRPPKPKRWGKNDIKTLMTQIPKLSSYFREIYCDEIDEVSLHSCVIKVVDEKNERALLHFNNGEKIIVNVPGILAPDNAEHETLSDSICTAKQIVLNAQFNLCVGKKIYQFGTWCTDLFEYVLHQNDDRHLVKVAKEIANAQFEFPQIAADGNVVIELFNFAYSDESSHINLNPGDEIVNLLWIKDDIKNSCIDIPDIEWSVAKVGDQHYLAVKIKNVISPTYKLSENHAKLIHVWLNLCD